LAAYVSKEIKRRGENEKKISINNIQFSMTSSIPTIKRKESN
jgi:hypothetical protein